ncbi:MAG: hydantoinase/oxoprolinase family protein [Natrialbaceae archaeon]|nr:hydantoinase/oxoprolinase family protein [Natrialbaceae archaeon]
MPGGSSVRVGIDVGGTFTDLVAIEDGSDACDEDGLDPEAPDEAVATALRESAVDPDQIDQLAHGTTVATNAVLEGTWADTALVTTEGFRDVLAIGRQTRPDIYNLEGTKPDPIVPRQQRFTVTERLDEHGQVIEPLSEASVSALIDSIESADLSAIAIALLFAFENDEHERAVRDRLRDAGIELPISLSSGVLPEIREYERSVATALNAALIPQVSTYLDRLTDEVSRIGCPSGLRVMHSGGGLITAEEASDRPVRTLLSGPAAGVIGSTHIGAAAGYDSLLTFDMGGTSCDVSLVRNGTPTITTDVAVGPYPVAVPMVDVHTVGAGGGSIGWLDDGRALRVGPDSAGADPGPVCYGRGGTAPTTTDAQHLLGRLTPDRFASSAIDVDRSAVESAFEPIAAALDTDIDGAARGLLEVAKAELERAIRVVSVERGHDPRTSTLVAYGGAGPLHGPALARSLDIPRVLIPPAAGVFSAVGLLVSDLVYEFGQTSVRPFESVQPAWLQSAFDRFESRGRDRLREEGIEEGAIRLERALDLRYRGQSYAVRFPVTSIDSDAIETTFHDRHRERYGHAAPGDPLELVAVRLRAIGETPDPTLEAPRETGDPDEAIRDTRSVSFDGQFRETPVYERAELPATGQFTGPALVDGTDHTSVVLPGQVATVDAHGSIIVTEAGDD